MQVAEVAERGLRVTRYEGSVSYQPHKILNTYQKVNDGSFISYVELTEIELRDCRERSFVNTRRR